MKTDLVRDEMACPSAAALAAFALGKLPLNGLERMAEHLGACAQCMKTLERVSDEADGLVAGLRRPPGENPYVHEPEYAAMEMRAKALEVAPAGPPVEPSPTTSLLVRVTGYEVERRIGQGSWGAVYRARQRAEGRWVALKILPAAANAPALRQRFAQVVAETARFAAARIMPIIDLVDADGRLVIVRPFVDGVDLGRIIKDRRALHQGKAGRRIQRLSTLPDAEYSRSMLGILDQVVESVAVLHEAQELYPELKPTNILIDDQSVGWLGDFGLARLAHKLTLAGGNAGRAPIEETELRIGTPGYIAPEEWSGERKLGPATDVFRLGVMIYQALTLELPYGIAPIGKRKPAPAPPSQRQPSLPATLDTVVLKALEVDTAKRYPSARELRAEWMKARGIGATGGKGKGLTGFLRRVFGAS
jgi:serine/threonine protein kinase